MTHACPSCTALMARLDRIEAKLDRLAPAPLYADPEPLPELVAALASSFGGDWFTSREAWHRASSDPALWAALQAAGIASSHRLGHWLGEQDASHVERGGMERAGNLWRACGMRGMHSA